MAEILHDFPITAPRPRIYAAVATPAGLDEWWTLRAKGEPSAGATYELFFGEGYDWRATVTQCEPDRMIEWEITRADTDWESTRVSVELSDRPEGITWVRFAHRGWPAGNEHFRVSSCCWAMYLRVLRRFVEFGERVPYADRLSI